MSNAVREQVIIKVVIVGSSRFKKEMDQLAEGIVTPRYALVGVPEARAKTPEIKKELALRHFLFIDDATVVLVYNGEEDYIGANTWMEIGYAYAKRKSIYTTHESSLDEIVALKMPVWTLTVL